MVDVHSSGKMIQTDQISKLIIGGQTGVDAIQFWFKKVLNGVDLSNPAYTWFIQFKNKNGDGESIPLQTSTDEEYVKMTWTPGATATQVPGRLQIQVYATIVEGTGETAVVTTRWVSEPAVVYVQENLRPDPIIPTELSVFDYYMTIYQSYKDVSETAAAAALASEQAAATSEGNAADSEAAALASKNAAATSEGNAADSAAAALAIYGSTQAVEAAVTAAATSEGNAADSAAAALASKNAAATSESNAADSAAAALASKNAAATSEGNAADSAAAALASKNAAATSEGNAADSEAAALASAQAAATSESNAADSEAAALASAQAAATSEGNAAGFATEAANSVAEINNRILPPYASDPTQDPDGSPLDAGDMYFNTTLKVLKVYDGTSWKVTPADAQNVGYDGAISGIEADNLQGAVDELSSEKENASNKKSTLSENSEVFFPNQKAVNDGLATKITRPTSTDKAIPRFSGTSGDLQNSGVTIDDSGIITPTGIFLGGASTANLLDDYEEGTWTPTLEAVTTNPTVDVYLVRTGKYTKIGNTVIVRCQVRATLSDIGSGYPIVTGLPFLAVNDFPGVSAGIKTIIDNFNNADVYVLNQEVKFVYASYKLVSSAYITFTAVYETTL